MVIHPLKRPWPVDERGMQRLLAALVSAHLGERADPFVLLDEEGLPKAGVGFEDLGLNLDSIDLMEMAGRIAQMFHLADFGNEDNLLRFRNLAGWANVLLPTWSLYGPKLSFHSSGSTSAPKLITHNQFDLLREWDELADLFAGVKRIVSLVPPHHIYGFLFTVGLPRRLDCELIEGRHLGPQALAGRLQPSDLLVSHPTHWRYLADTLNQFPKGVVGVTSTAPCPPELVNQLLDMGLERLTEVYGSTETGGIGFRHNQSNSRPDYELFASWSRVDEVTLTRTNEQGEQVSFATPDRLNWCGEHRFQVAGRRDGAVQVAGHNVYPDKIAAALAGVCGVHACVVRKMNPAEGSRLKAFVVPETGVDQNCLRRDLFQWAADHLETPERPTALRFGAFLPVNQMGKPADWPI